MMLILRLGYRDPVLYPTFCFQFTKNRKRNLFEYLIGGKITLFFITGTVITRVAINKV